MRKPNCIISNTFINSGYNPPDCPLGMLYDSDSEIELIVERDNLENVLDKVLDVVLGTDREEWSSSYDYNNAINDVEERMVELTKAREHVPMTEEQILKVIFSMPHKELHSLTHKAGPYSIDRLNWYVKDFVHAIQRVKGGVE